MAAMKIPVATYRIQFNPSFGFAAAEGVLPYLFELGVTDLYASPIFKARKGSGHGYDVVDPNQFNPELGAFADFERLVEAVQKLGMGWLQDIVPNHMAFDHENAMLMDVLENGECSPYFRFFDIDWEHPYESMKGRILAPFLGRFYAETLEQGEIKLKYDPEGFAVTYYEWVFPLKIESYAAILTHQLDTLKRRVGRNHPDFINLLGVLYVLRTLSTGDDFSERYDQINFIKRMLWLLYTKNEDIKNFLDENILIFNGEKEGTDGHHLFNRLLFEQYFRLSFWKVATEEINYKRFFNINELISLNVRFEDVFASTHSLIFRLLGEKKISGLRVDHIDGLYDPSAYLQKLRDKAKNIFLVVEKILELDEELPDSWPVQGTTGYDFMNYLNGIFCRRENEKALTRTYRNFTGVKEDYQNLVRDKKRLIIGKHMAGDVDNLAHLLKALSSRDRYGGDITLYALKRALVEVMAQFPVYRTYVSREVFREEDSLYIKLAVNRAIRNNPELVNALEFIRRFLLLQFEEHLPDEDKEERLHFVMRFQQLTGPLMAKGVEDTVLYVYNRLLSLNEVGGSPERFGISVGAFHSYNRRKQEEWPHSLNATSTHDTKRGEDLRARLNVISEVPKEWDGNLKAWRKINSRKRRKAEGRTIPDRNDEYFFYQTLVGGFPFDEREYSRFVERVKDYIIKAVREAKVHTAWLKPDSHYEDKFISFVEAVLAPGERNRFLKEFRPFQKKIAHYGIFNSLSQTLIKITSPGVPDFYQGSELWDFNFVDPDNRRPVDFEKRKTLLADLKKRARKDLFLLLEDLLAKREDGRIKLFLIHRALEARKANRDLFNQGAYIPLQVAGSFRDHIIAFARNLGNSWALTVAPRFLVSVAGEGQYPLGAEVWRDTKIVIPEDSASQWLNVLTGEELYGQGQLAVGEVLQRFPAALLLASTV